MRDMIKKILREFIEESKEEFKWRDVQTNKESTHKTHISVFFTDKFKYIVEVEEYDNNFYLISFFPKLNTTWHDKQAIRKYQGQDYIDKYSYRTNEDVANKIFATLIEHMEDILKDDPYASFGYFGAPDIKTDSDEDIKNTQRFRVYNYRMNKKFGDTHNIIGDETFSGGLVINKKTQEVFPDIVNYGNYILTTHL